MAQPMWAYSRGFEDENCQSLSASVSNINIEFVCSFNFDLGEKAVAALLIPASLFLKIPFNLLTRVLLILKCPQLYQSIIILLKKQNIGSNGKFDYSSKR